MPITGPASYLGSSEQFLAHWALANVALPPVSPLVLPGPGTPPGPAVTLAGLEALYNSLVTKRAELQSKLNAQEIARASIDLQKQAMLLRANQFNDSVRALLAGSMYEMALPNVPGLLMGAGPFSEPLDDAVDIWERINIDGVVGGDLTLLGDYTQAQFVADVATLKLAFRAFNAADVHTGFTRSQRNGLQDQIYPLIKSYRRVLPTKFAKTHALVVTLPKVTPEPGSTPAAVTLTATWDPAENKVRLTWTASTAADFAEYEIRYTPGPVYSKDDDSVIGNIADIGTLEFLTDVGVGAPNITGSYKVFVKTTTGNEKGSNAVAVTHPSEVPPPSPT